MRRLLSQLHPRPWLEALWPAPHDVLLSESPWEPEPAGFGCPRCGVSRGTAPHCPHCAERRPPWSRVIRLGPWEPPLTALIAEMKYHGAWSIAEWLAPKLAARIPLADAAPLLIPVPMHWRRRVARGYNQSELLARAMARPLCGVCLPALRRVRHAPRQSAQAKSARAGNVRGVFGLAPCAHRLKGRRVILVDDVLTTGATARACARLLRRAGAAEITLAVVAVADPPGWTGKS